MPIETLEDIVEDLANQLGIYGAERRSPWTSDLDRRIRRSIQIEQAIVQAQQSSGEKERG